MPDSAPRVTPPAPILLASRSPRRAELLRQMGFPFRVMESGVDEADIQADHPRTFALRAAYAKGRDVAARAEPPAIIVAADTVVTLNLELYGKPRTKEEARRMLRRLSGATHEVITALAILEAGKPSALLDSETTRVTFRALSGAEIERYIATREPFDKAGAYGIQGEGGALVESIEGDYFNVVGFPCALFLQMIGQFMDVRGIRPPAIAWRPAPRSGREESRGGG